MCKYMLSIHTQHTKTTQDITHSNNLQELVDTADYMKHRLHKDETITVIDTTTGELMHKVERW